MKELRNTAELQSSCISIFQVLTCTRHYTDYHPSAKVNGGRLEGRNHSSEGLSEGNCSLPQITTKGSPQKVCLLDIRKSKGTVGYQHFAKSRRILEKR